MSIPPIIAFIVNVSFKKIILISNAQKGMVNVTRVAEMAFGLF